jgi:hypothetical protein
LRYSELIEGDLTRCARNAKLSGESTFFWYIEHFLLDKKTV